MSEQTNSIKSLEFSKIAQFPTLTPLTLYDPGGGGGGGGFFALTHLILELHYCVLVTFPKK